MANLARTIAFSEDLEVWATNCDNWWMNSPESISEFEAISDLGRENFTYSGFDAVAMLKVHGPTIALNPELYCNVCILVAMRGTNASKFKNKMSDEGLRVLANINNVFRVEWKTGANIKRTTLTPGRLVLLCPELAAQSMRKVNLGVNGNFPYPYRTQAISALIPEGFVTMREAAYMAAYHLTRTTAPNLDRRVVFDNTIVYVNAGMSSRLVSNDRRKRFWQNVKRTNTTEKWAEIVQGIKKMALDFAEIRAANNNVGPALDAVYNPNVENQILPAPTNEVGQH